jgi:hypothetical protein
LGLRANSNLFAYAAQRPTLFVDPLGLKVELWCHPIGAGGGDSLRQATGSSGFGHCFVRVKCDNCEQGGDPYDLRLEVTGRDGNLAVVPPTPPSYSGGHNASIVPISPGNWDSNNCDLENCIKERYEFWAERKDYPYGSYYFGPNSNTFANFLLRGCGIKTIFWPDGIPPYN